MTKNTFLNLLSKKSAGTITEKENLRLEKALAENAYFRSIYTEFQHYMAQKSTVNVDVEAKLQEIWQQIENGAMPADVQPMLRKRLVPMWLKAAASVLILFGVGFGLLKKFTKTPENIYTEILTSGNEKLFAVLDDGTQVWLNKNSTLAYNADFGKKHREITLTGEAFFDAAHNPAVPLTVHSQEVDVTVKGTVFNVNSYTQNQVEVALLRGLVAIKSGKEKEVLLYPNHKLMMQNGKKVALDTIKATQTAQKTDTIPAETRWTAGNLTFTKQRFADLARLMETRYRVSIQISSPALRNKRFTGSITGEKLTEMLDALKLSYPFTYKMEENKVIIQTL